MRNAADRAERRLCCSQSRVRFVALHAAVGLVPRARAGTPGAIICCAGSVDSRSRSRGRGAHPRVPGGRTGGGRRHPRGCSRSREPCCAIFDARAVGARGEDWTGFLLAPVGLALFALRGGAALALAQAGTAPLCSAGPALVLGIVLGVFWLVVPLAIAILATHRPRAARRAASHLGRPYEHVTLRTSDGLDLAGWYVRVARTAPQ